MEPKAVLARCREYYAVLTPEDGRLVIDSPEPLPDDLRRELREHKPEIIALLRVRPPEWHANALNKAFRRDNFCIFWSDLFGEAIAYIRDESFRSKIPGNIVCYTGDELREMFGEGKPSLPPATKRLIHEAKKHGGKVAEYGSKDVREC